MTGTINQDGGSQNAYMSTALCSGTRGGKNISESFVVEKETLSGMKQYRAG